MGSSLTLSQSDIKRNIEALQKLLKENKLDGMYISSFDAFLNEYVPMEDCHRFYVTNFNGSTAEVLLPATGRVKLYVDGRYHEQADLQVDATLVEVVKVGANLSLTGTLLEDMTKLKMKSIGVESPRTPLSFFQTLNQKFKVHSFTDELNRIIDFKKMPALLPIRFEIKENRGRDTIEKLQQAITEKSMGYYITAIDSLAWLTNCRGYHLPNLSSFLGRGLAVFDKVYVFIEKSTPVSEEAKAASGVEFIACDISEIGDKLKDLQKKYQLETVSIDPKMLNAADYLMLSQVFGDKVLKEEVGGLVKFHSIKEDLEIKAIQRSFNKANKAIFNTIQWVKSEVANGKAPSEYDLYLETTKKYEAEGSIEQSFNTIAGVGANGSIIHYGDPKKDVHIQKEDMILLDSGGYFDGGFATDTTRTFMASSVKPHPDYIKMYTLVLKGLLQCQNAIFPVGTRGSILDAYARKALFDHGYNYNHGTGHGVGIHVHEGGVRISPISDLPMKEGQVVSIEPGLYIPGFGGVRIENIVFVKKHNKHKDFLCFEPLTFIGFEPTLINMDLLTDQEKEWLKIYESECKTRGTSFIC